jgi:glycosyltransferase involved in cell wall biosynthesis
MKIGVIAHLKNAIREPFAGGLEMHTYSLCKSLRQRGHDVTLFAAAGSAGGLGLEAICADNGQKTAATDEEFRQEHSVYLRLMESLRHRDFDIIHNNSLHYLPPALAAGLPMPMVTVLHTPPFWEMEGSIMHNMSDNSTFIAVSSFIGACWERITHLDGVIHNGIDLDKFAFAPSPAVPRYLVWSGRIVPEKGLKFAMAAARLAGLELRIAGPVSDPAYFERDIAPFLSGHARYVGHVNHSDLRTLIANAAALLFTPLWDEPFGLVLAEALACGTPVASFARGAVAEILDATCGIIVPPEDVVSLARAARDVQRFSRPDCRRRAKMICNVEDMITRYEDLYRRLTRRRNSRQRSRLRGFPVVPDSRALLDHYMMKSAAMLSEIPPDLRP